MWRGENIDLLAQNLFDYPAKYLLTFSTFGLPGGTVVKNLPANAGNTGDGVLIPGSGNPLEEEKATHSSILAWRIPQTEEPGGAIVHGGHKRRAQTSACKNTATQTCASAQGTLLSIL